jgi:hypothetical protein
VVEGLGEGLGVGACVGVAVGEAVGLAVGAGVGVAEASNQFQVIVEGAVIANVVADEVPEDATLPVPDQPEQVYPEAGDETKAVMLVLLSYHLLVGEGESNCDVTVK